MLDPSGLCRPSLSWKSRPSIWGLPEQRGAGHPKWSSNSHLSWPRRNWKEDGAVGTQVWEAPPISRHYKHSVQILFGATLFSKTSFSLSLGEVAGAGDQLGDWGHCHPGCAQVHLTLCLGTRGPWGPAVHSMEAGWPTSQHPKSQPQMT